MTLLNLATWLLSGRFTAAAPGATEFLGDAISTLERGRIAAEETSVMALAFGILWKLALVVVLIWVTVWLLRRTLKTGGLPAGAQGAVKVIAVTHLDARHAVYVVEVGDRLLVVGAGSDSMSLLVDIASEKEKASIREQIQEPPRGRFGSYLSAWVARMSGGGSAKQQLQESREFLSGRLESLRRQRGEGSREDAS